MAGKIHYHPQSNSEPSRHQNLPMCGQGRATGGLVRERKNRITQPQVDAAVARFLAAGGTILKLSASVAPAAPLAVNPSYRWLATVIDLGG